MCLSDVGDDEDEEGCVADAGRGVGMIRFGVGVRRDEGGVKLSGECNEGKVT